jgi:cytochrome d ubiquinol oxidase subunit II
MAQLDLALAVAGVIAYVTLAGADYGAGFWDLTAGGPRRGGRIRGLVIVAMTPVWEANHVWLPFVLVVLWTAFPPFYSAVMSTLYVPVLIALGGVVFRGAAFALRGYARSVREGRVLGALFAVSSVLVPFCLGAVAGAIASARVPPGNAAGAPFGSWLAPTPIALGVVTVATGAFLAAVFLTDDARRRDLPDVAEAMRRRALGAGVVTGALALAALIVVRFDARPLFDGLTSGLGLVCVILSGLAGVGTAGLVAARHSHQARYVAAGAVTFIVLGWVAAQQPDLLPHLTLQQAAAPQATLVAVFISFCGGAVILVPSLILLYRLMLRGKLDKPYQALDEALEGPA